MKESDINEMFDKTISSLVKQILSIDDLSLTSSLGPEHLDKIKYEHRKAIYRCMDRMKETISEAI